MSHAALRRAVSVPCPRMERAYREDIDYYEERATGLLASATDGTPEALAAFEEAGAALTIGGARDTVARRHGLDLVGVAAAPPAGPARARPVRARLRRDRGARRRRAAPRSSRRTPEIVTARGTNGNDLLGMATATCDERLVALLLERGADPAGANVHGWTALHQAAYVGLPALAQMLLDAGAPVDVSARGDGGTPLVVALFWGHALTAELLARVGRAPAQPARGGGPRPGGPRRGAARHAAGRRAARLLPAALGLPALAAVRRSAGDRRRGARVGRAQRPRGRPRRARRARRRDRRRRLPRHRADVGRRLRARRGDRAAARARRRSERPLDVRRRGPRRRRDGRCTSRPAPATPTPRGRCSPAAPTRALRDLGYHGTPADWAEHSCDDAELTALLREREG